MNKELRNALLGGTALIGAGLLMLPDIAEAQQAPGATLTTQSAFRADAASFTAGNTRTSCTTTQDSVANLTLTITPPAGNYVYLTGFFIEAGTNATGAASAVAWSSTNLTGSPAWLSSTNAVTTAPSTQQVAEIYPTGMKSTVAGTAVTIVPNVTMASAYQCVHAVGYYSPL